MSTAAFQREKEAFYSDAEAMKQWRRLWQHAVQGSIHDELLEEAARIASAHRSALSRFSSGNTAFVRIVTEPVEKGG